MSGVQLLPADTLFFRDGVPFTIEGPQFDVGGVFPPHPPTVVGAIRAGLARCQGWSGRGSWSKSIGTVLGDGLELGKLAFAGPAILHNGEPLVPVPAHVLGEVSVDEQRWQPKVALRPGPARCCDLGDAVRLPAPPAGAGAKAARPAKGWWLTRPGLARVLRGELPVARELVHSSRLWTEEFRVGLGRHHETRTAKEGMLYSARHVRLQPGVTIGAELRGLPESWRWPWGELVRFGGEGRTSELARWSGRIGVRTSSAVINAIEDSGRLMVIALTPLDLEPELGGQLGFPDALGLELVSACVDRAQRVGGWSFRPFGPLPLRDVVPAGSVFFCECNNPRQLRALLHDDELPPQLGMRQAWGFGVIALGTWADDSKR